MQLQGRGLLSAYDRAKDLTVRPQAPKQPKTRAQMLADLLGGGALASSMIPGVGDAAGMAADAAMYAAYPEQRNWLNYGMTALSALPIVPAVSAMKSAGNAADTARLKRAAEQGFDVSRPVYHGTSTDFKAFDPDRALGTQYWSTTDRAAVESGNVGASGKGVIKEMYHRIKNPAGWDEYDKYGIDEMIAKGFDGLALPDADGHITYVAFDPNQYRDVKAKFDPKRIKSSDLMAGIGGAAIVGGSALSAKQRNERKPD